MTVDIEKIKVKDRIRKDFGDIQELADDIRQNGLINPPVVNKEYELLAGERRLKACKALGWQQIEVRMMDTRDAEHELNVEISENENRKEFSKAERTDYMKRLLRIEQAKAKERQTLGEKFPEGGGRARDKAAEQFGMSGKQMEKELSIVDNKGLLSPEDFAEWDEGKLSTNKAFQKIKAQLRDLKEERDYFESVIENKNEIIKELSEQEPQTVEVVPDDYEKAKKDAETYKIRARSAEQARLDVSEELRKAKQRIRDLEERKDIAELQKKLEEEAGYFTIRTYDYIQKNGGFVWITERLEQLPEKQRKEFIATVYAIDAFAKQMIENVGGYGIE